MKILLVSNFADCGGVESVIRELANMYIKKYEVHFMYFDGKCNICFDKNIKIHFINNHSIVQKPSFKINREIKRFFGEKILINKFKEINPDIVIAFKPFVGVAIAKLKSMFNFKLIVSLHGNYVSDTQGYNIKKLANDFKNIDILTVLTEENKIFYEQYLKCKIRTMPNPINLPKLEIKKENIICCVGRVDKDKRTDLFIKAVALCQDKLKDYRFLIAGDGSELEKMKKLAKDIGAKVEFLGKLSQIDTYKLYAKAKINILCSISEGYPYTLVEPMFYKCIRISTKFIGGSLKILIDDKIDGYICDFDEKEIANIVCKITDDDYTKVIDLAYNKFQNLYIKTNKLWDEIIRI